MRQIGQNLANAKAARAFDGWNRGWIKIVERHVGAWAHVEHGIGMHVYLPAQRDAPTNMINNALSVGLRAQAALRPGPHPLQPRAVRDVEGFDGEAHKEAWNRTRSGRACARTSRSITGIRDWAEAFFAAAVVFEPLVGELFRSEFVMQAAAPQGDFVTPTLMGAGESDTARDARVPGRCSGCSPTTRSTARRTRRRCTAG